MKVALFAAPFGQGGQMHIHCRRYVRLLQLGGCDVTLIEHSAFQSSPIPGVDHRVYPRRMRRLDPLLSTRMLSFLHKRRLAPLLRSANADLCHLQWVDERVFDLSLAGGRPLVASAWGSDLNVPLRMPATSPARQRIGAALRELDLLIVDCDDSAAAANELAGVEVPVASLPIGIDTQLFQPDLPQARAEWRQRFQIEPDALVFLSGRQLGAIYRPAEIIEAFAAMPAADRQRAYLIMRIFGHSVGTSLRSLQELTRALGIEQRVRWIGGMPYERQPGLFVAADFMVNFPRMDAFPVTFLESLACGVPVLTNRLKSYDSNGATPYLNFTEEDSVGALSATMSAALDSVEALRAQALRGREHVVRNFDERISAAQLKEIYDGVLLRHSTRNPA